MIRFIISFRSKISEYLILTKLYVRNKVSINNSDAGFISNCKDYSLLLRISPKFSFLEQKVEMIFFLPS